MKTTSPRRYAQALLVLGLVLLERIPDLFYHFHDWDEASAMAQAWSVTRGQILYKDIFQFHPVLHFGVFMPFFYFLSSEAAPHAIKAFNLALIAWGAFLIYRIAVDWLEDKILALMGALIFVAPFADPSWSMASYGEFYSLFPVLLSIPLLFFSKTKSLWRAFLVGVLWGAAFFLKQTAVFDAAALWLGFMLSKSERKLACTAAIAAGFAAVFAAISACFLSVGAWSEAMDSMLLLPIRYSSHKETAQRYLSNVLPALKAVSPFFVLSALGLGRLLVELRRTQPKDARDRAWFFFAMFLWLVIDMLAISRSGRWYAHYLIQVIPPLALCSLFALAMLSENDLRLARNWFIAFLLWTRGLDCGLQLKNLAAADWLPPTARQSVEVARYIKEVTREGDEIFLFTPRNLDIFYLSERLSNNGITMYKDMFAFHMHDRELERRKKERFLAHLPAAIVFDPSYEPEPDEKEIGDFFEPIIRKDYRLGATIQGMRVFVRKPSSAPPASTTHR